MELLTAARMRAIEGAEIASGRVSGAALMERAAEGAARGLRNRAGRRGAQRPAGAALRSARAARRGGRRLSGRSAALPLRKPAGIRRVLK